MPRQEISLPYGITSADGRRVTAGAGTQNSARTTGAGDPDGDGIVFGRDSRILNNGASIQTDCIVIGRASDVSPGAGLNARDIIIIGRENIVRADDTILIGSRMGLGAVTGSGNIWIRPDRLNAGILAVANPSNAIGIGTHARLGNSASIGIGLNATAAQGSSIAIGPNATVGNTGMTGGIAIGSGASSTGDLNAIAFGVSTQATGFAAIAIGHTAVAVATDSIAIGRGATIAAGATDALIFGRAAASAGANSVTFGSGAAPKTRFRVVADAAGNSAFESNASVTADDVRFLVWDVTGAALKQISRGAVDSGGAGFRLLRIPN